MNSHRYGIVPVRAIVVEEVDQADMMEGDGNRRGERQSHLIPDKSLANRWVWQNKYKKIEQVLAGFSQIWAKIS